MKTIYVDEIAEVEVSYRPKQAVSTQRTIETSLDASKMLRELWNDQTIQLFEEFKVLLLNRRNTVKGVYTNSKGGISGTVVDPKLIFSVALKTASSGLILCHNHPSGNTRPSETDKALTEKLVKAAKYLEIRVFDHIILTVDSYFSFSDEGLL